MIRCYSSQDTDREVRIWLEASILGHHFVPALYWIGKEEDMRNQYLPLSQIYVFEEEESKVVQGFVAMVNNYLAALFVIPEVQGRGIGRSLMEYVKALHGEITLRVYVKNEHAVLFYEKLGYDIIEEQLDIETGEREYVMKWEK